jgi:hypothetical protein
VNRRQGNTGRWLTWLGAVWLFAIFIASIVDYSRGVDVVWLLVAFIGQLVIAIAWTLWRPLPLWIVSGYGLVLLAGVVGLLITVPGSLFLSWTMIGYVPIGLLMIVAAIVEMDRSTSLTH